MALLGPSREKRGPDPLLDTKIVLFLIGGLLAVTGMLTERPLLVWFAFLPLGIVGLLRFFRRPQ